MLICTALAALSLAQGAVDLAPALPESRTLVWTHTVSATEESHWGSAEVRAVVLTRQEVERGGRPGMGRLEWRDEVEDIGAELDIGTRTVSSWRGGDEGTDAEKLQRFEALEGTQWSSLLHATGEQEWFQVRGEDLPAYPTVPGPRPPELLAWYQGLALGGPPGVAWDRYAPGEARTYRAEYPVWGVGTATVEVHLTLAGIGPRLAEIHYVALPVQLPRRRLGVELVELEVEGTALFDRRRHLLEEHHQTVRSVVMEGSFPFVRLEKISTYLHRVRRRTPRREREARLRP